MPRAAGGFTSHRRHHKVLKITAGHRGSKHRLFRRANESMLHALRYATRDRRNRKRDMRRLWIVRINAGARLNGSTYSRMMSGLRVAGVTINRKILADLAATDPGAFAQLVEVARQSATAAA